MIFVAVFSDESFARKQQHEDIDFRVWPKGMLSKHTLDAGFGQFISILQWVCWKRGVYFSKVNKDYTSQVCPQCDTHTGLKELSDRIHACNECGYTTSRYIAAAQVIRFSRHQ